MAKKKAAAKATKKKTAKKAVKKPTKKAVKKTTAKAPPSVKSGGRTQAQSKALHQALEKQVTHERTGKSHSLKVSYQRGQVSRRVMSKEKRATFGPVALEDVASILGVHRSTVQQSMKFAQYINRSTLDELCSMDNPPSWRMMMQWVGIKDEARRATVLRNILSGKLKADGFEANLREALDRGPKKSRRPAGGAATFRKIGAEAATFTEHLGWVGKAATEINKMKDETAKREAKTVVRETLKQMEAAKADLESAIAECKKMSA